MFCEAAHFQHLRLTTYRASGVIVRLDKDRSILVSRGHALRFVVSAASLANRIQRRCAVLRALIEVLLLPLDLEPVSVLPNLPRVGL